MSILHIGLAGYQLNYHELPILIEVIDDQFHTEKMVMKGSAEITVKPGIYFVRAHLPSGEIVVSTTMIPTDSQEYSVILTPMLSPHEWLAWPQFLGEVARTQHPEEKTLDQFPSIWLRMWVRSQHLSTSQPHTTQSLIAGPWRTLPSSDWLQSQLQTNEVASCELFPRVSQPFLSLLQVGGLNVPSRLISLPPTPNSIQVIIRPSRIPTDLNGGLTVKVMSQNQKAEILLHYIASGLFEAAQVISDEVMTEAEQLLRQKRANPVGAAIGGYYLLNTGALHRLHNWANNLADWFTWLPDGAIIHAWQLLRQPNRRQPGKARERLLQAVERGLPVYKEGLRLLIAGLELFADDAIAHQRRDEAVEHALKTIRRYATAVDWNQQLTTFYGSDPQTPSLQPVRGVPNLTDDPDLYVIATG